MNKNKIQWTALVAVLALVVVTSGCNKLRARDQLNKGVTAFSNAQYPEAVEFFQQSVDLDPEFATARLYLATAYMSQYIPGAESPDNLEMAQKAQDEFQKVLDTDPNNTNAIASIASLHFHKKEFDQAQQWNERLISVDPNYKEAYYTLGVIAWSRTFPKRMEARAEVNMAADEVRLTDDDVRATLSEENLPVVENGIESLNKALEIDPEYDDAMAYLNLLYREKADLEPTQEAYDQDIDTANKWIDKTLATKKLKAQRAEQASYSVQNE